MPTRVLSVPESRGRQVAPPSALATIVPLSPTVRQAVGRAGDAPQLVAGAGRAAVPRGAAVGAGQDGARLTHGQADPAARARDVVQVAAGAGGAAAQVAPPSALARMVPLSPTARQFPLVAQVMPDRELSVPEERLRQMAPPSALAGWCRVAYGQAGVAVGQAMPARALWCQREAAPGAPPSALARMVPD